MSLIRQLIFSLLASLAVWTLLSWPLPLHVHHAIPSSAENAETPPVRAMTPGDHLQLLYNYWLVADMVAGHTPWAANPYEFNVGAHAPLRRDAWGNLLDQPFTAFFTLGFRLGGRAFAWNLTGFLSLWLTLLATWMLTRRFCASPALALLAALPPLRFTFRWTNLLGGSPMGFAMMWVPLLFWGIDSALFQRQWRGALLAALAIICMRWGDTHVFFFSVIALPAWCLFLLLVNRRQFGDLLRHGPAILLRLALPILTAGILVIAGQIQKSTQLADTTIGGGRAWREIALYSPRLSGLWSWPAQGVDAQIFLGYALILFFGGVALWALVRWIRDREGRDTQAALLLLLAGIALMILLALGTNGPHEAAPLRWARKFIPPYSMVRQPAKILCLLPTLTAVFIALFLNTARARRIALLFAGTLLSLFAAESALKIQPTLCLLDTRQSAYAAVAQSAADQGRPPHALIVPLWPGDSAWTSLYEHYASLYRIRMLNGYTPIVPHDYIRDVFDRFQSANGGNLSDAQLDELLRRGVDYLILHEDAFPEKVSYFPVAFTLHQLLNHPRLEWLAQDRAAWAFKIRAQPLPRPSPPEHAESIFFPTFVREFEWYAAPEQRREDPSTLGQAYAALTPAHPALTLPPFENPRIPHSRFLIRARGPGSLQGTLSGAEGDRRELTLDIPSDQWTWLELPFTPTPPTPVFTPTLAHREGIVQLDVLLFSAGPWPPLAPGQSRALPAPLFFHAGYTDPETQSVRLDPERESHGVVFYGLRLPLEPGAYRIALDFTASSQNDVPLAQWGLFMDGQPLHPAVPVIAGQPSETTVEIPDNRPVEFRLDYRRTHPLSIRQVLLQRK